jgi:uncharacterized protein DUF4202
MGDRRRPAVSAPVAAGDHAVTPLESAAEEWIAPYWNAEHLRRTRDWLLVLDPEASEALRIAALTHDIERHFPGGPTNDLTVSPEEDMEYRREHSERSAQFVTAWLREQGAGAQLICDVQRLILAHEIGGEDEEDLLQAADSLSFLEVNVDLPARWAAENRCSFERGIDQHRWMFERIKVPRAREAAQPLFELVRVLAA